MQRKGDLLLKPINFLQVGRSKLLPLMQGQWQSISDAGYQIEIDGEKIRHYNGGKLTIENEIEADAGCTNNTCTITGNQLEYTAIGSAGQSLVFQKADGAAVQ